MADTDAAATARIRTLLREHAKLCEYLLEGSSAWDEPRGAAVVRLRMIGLEIGTLCLPPAEDLSATVEV